MHDVIIVGSGASSMGAALGLSENGIKPLILDVGLSQDQKNPEIEENLYDFKKSNDSFDLTIGENLRGLHNFTHSGQPLPVKLIAPKIEFVTRDSDSLSPINGENFSPIQSFAAGGLANIWGAGLYRCTENDLKLFPISVQSLTPYFDRLTQEIGISGTDDDLSPFFSSHSFLQPPPRLSFNAAHFYKKYKKRQTFLNSNGIFIGRARVAALTQPIEGRTTCDYTNLEFWQPGLPYIYTPLFTLKKLIEQEKVYYKNSHLVTSWKEEQGSILVEAIDVNEKKSVAFRTKKLLLAAGAINTTKIVLASRKDFQTKLPLLDNPALQIPLLFPFSIGRHIEKDAFGLVQLNLIWDKNNFGEVLQASIMEITSPMRAEFFSKLPLCSTANLDCLRYLLPAMMVMQLFFPSSVQQPSWLGLNNENSLVIDGRENDLDVSKAKQILPYLRSIGAFSHPSLFVKVPTGQSVHYGGTLPMREYPDTSYQCHPSGRLNLTDNVYIVDGSAFPEIPAKNYSFTMMANAMRVADMVSSQLKS